MISQNNADFMAWSQFLKGNYAKGLKRLESLLRTPAQAVDLIADKAALAVIFGSRDSQTEDLLDIIRESEYADRMVANYVASVADSDEGFVAASNRDVIANVCTTSAAVGQPIGRAFWEGEPNDFIGQISSEKGIDAIAKNLAHATRDSFEKVKPANLSKISLAVGKNDGSAYSHLLGAEVELGVESVKYPSGYKEIAPDSPCKGIGFKVIGFCADEQKDGGKIGFSLMSKYPLRFSYSASSDSDPITGYNSTGYPYYYSSQYADPETTGSYNWIPNTCIHKVMGSSVTLRGEIFDLARPSLRRWMNSSVGYVSNSNKTSKVVKNEAAYQRFWTPSLGNIFGEAAQERVGDKFWSDDRGAQYGWFEDFENFKSSVLKPEKYYYLQKSANIEIADGDPAPNYRITNSSYMTNVDAATADASSTTRYIMSPVIAEDGAISFDTRSRNSVSNNSFGQTIYTCI